MQHREVRGAKARPASQGMLRRLLLAAALLASAQASAQYCNEPLSVNGSGRGGGTATTSNCYDDPSPPPPPTPEVIGHIDGLSGGQIVGWACATHHAASIDVHLYLGGPAGSGTGVATATANLPSEPGVSQACSTSGVNHRFAIPVTEGMIVHHGGQAIYVHGISPVGGANNLLSNSGVHTIPVNAAPTVQLTAPTAGAAGIAPVTLQLRADAHDGDDGVASVTFHANGQVLHTATAAPYEFVWSGVGPGNYDLQAVVRDTRGATGASAVVQVSVAASQIVGHIEGVYQLANGEYEVQGWACSTGIDGSIDIHTYLGGPAGSGSYLRADRADRASEPGVAQACQANGTRYRFGVPLGMDVRQQHAGKTIHIHGISPVGQPNLLIGQSGQFTVPGVAAAPSGPSEVVRRYVYDQHQQLCKTIEPETGSTVMAYDAAGNLAWSAAGLDLPDPGKCNGGPLSYDSGRRVDRAYDARNRLTSLAFPDGNGNQAWSYTPDGLPAQIVTWNDGGATQAINAYSYNRRRLLTGETVSQPGWYTWGIGYAFDPHGNLQGLQYPTGLYVDYAPNALGQPRHVSSAAGTYASGIGYHPNGSIRQFTYGNGVVHQMGQNARQLPARVINGGVFDHTFRYDRNGNVTNIDDVYQQHGVYSGSRDMAYDGLDRLTYAHLHWQQVNEYRYDVLDNIRSASHFNGAYTATRSYHYDAANRLTNLTDDSGATVVGLGYDAQGNLANRNGQAYRFDYGNRLRQVGDYVEGYRYDALGRRVLAWTPTGGSILSQYAQNGQLLYQHDERRGKGIEHVYLAGSVVALREYAWGTGQTTVRYQHTDALGSPVAVTDAAGQVVERTHYAPYGAPINRTVVGIGYTGHVMDAETGLVNMQQRYYDPGIGRFLSVDPITANSSTGANFNRYWYANNNPYRFTDPDGRCAKNAKVFNTECEPPNDQIPENYFDLPELPPGEYFEATGVYIAEGWEEVTKPTGDERINWNNITENNADFEINPGDFFSNLSKSSPALILLGQTARALSPKLLYGIQRGEQQKEHQIGWRHILYRDPGNGGQVTRSPMYRHGVIWTQEKRWVGTNNWHERPKVRVCKRCD